VAEMEKFTTLVENTFAKVEQVHGNSRLEHLDLLQEKLANLDFELTEFLLNRTASFIEVEKNK